jgi:hypothetical protein
MHIQMSAECREPSLDDGHTLTKQPECIVPVKLGDNVRKQNLHKVTHHKIIVQ